jgi:hypothetical protein
MKSNTTPAIKSDKAFTTGLFVESSLPILSFLLLLILMA